MNTFLNFFLIIAIIYLTPAFIRFLIKKLTSSKIAVSSLRSSDRNVKKTRILIQNQRNVEIKEEISVEIPILSQSWPKNSDIPLISVTHGPLKANFQNPKIDHDEKALEENKVILNFPAGMRPLATWLIACNTENIYPETISVKVGEQEEQRFELDELYRAKQNEVFTVGVMFGYLFVFLVVFSLSVLFFHLGFDVTKELSIGLTDFLFFTITLLTFFIIAAIFINLLCRMDPAYLIQGYIIENDKLISTTFPKRVIKRV